MQSLLSSNKKAYQAGVVRVEALAAEGHRLRRPLSAPLRDGIHELRWVRMNVNYRILYFFDGREAVVLTHGITKEAKVPDAEIDRAVKRRGNYLQDRKRYGVEVRL